MLAVNAVNAVYAFCAVLAVQAVCTVLTVHAVGAVDVAILIGDEVGVGGSVLVYHGFFSYKLAGVALPK